MTDEKTSTLNNGLIWFGAAVSIAEILTGALLAPLGFKRGILAIIIGHLIGCVLLYFAGLIGANTQKSSMETVKISFGERGAKFFSFLNILQLAGWTAVMIQNAASAAGVLTENALGPYSVPLWCGVICALIILWVLVDIKSLERLNTVAMGALFVLTLILSFMVFGGKSGSGAIGEISIGSAVELSVIMPLSWLPLISDYTSRAKNPKAATAVSAAVYFLTSSWMYAIGLAAVIFTGESDIAKIMLKTGLGIAAIVIIIFSCVTTTFLDVYSAGVSFMSISKKPGTKAFAVFTTVLGAVLAVFTSMEKYERFLYFIGSVFAPMVAILLTDYFIFKRDTCLGRINKTNLIIWLLGFIAYRLLMTVDTIIGSTVPAMLFTGIICVIIKGGKRNVKANSK